jgi:hypothetical protein
MRRRRVPGDMPFIFYHVFEPLTLSYLCAAAGSQDHFDPHLFLFCLTPGTLVIRTKKEHARIAFL